MSQKITNQLKGNLAVLFGGESAERQVSLDSGKRVLEAFGSLGIPVFAIDCKTSDLFDELKVKEIKHCFIALHGGDGEDGTIQSILKSMDISFTGSSPISSAIAMDKQRSKLIWQGDNMPTARFCMVDRKTSWLSIVNSLGEKIMIKPSHEGSSIGMAIVDSEIGFARAIDDAQSYDQEVMAEKWIDGKEYTVAILNNEALPPIRMQTDHSFYNYEAKYVSGDTQYFCPCGLASDREERLKNLALKAFKLLGCSGWGRVDFMMDKQGNEYILEVNTQPGMTAHSLVPMSAAVLGISFEQLVLKILEASLSPC